MDTTTHLLVRIRNLEDEVIRTHKKHDKMEKRVEEYEDKVPMMLDILRRVKAFGNAEDANHAHQVVEFFESQKAGKVK